jgi:hypothetical protein
MAKRLVTFTSRVLYWLGLLAVGLLCLVNPLKQADPLDDFSLTLSGFGSSIEGDHPSDYRLMKQSEVARIFKERLDLFPLSKAPELAGHLLDLCRKHRFDPAFLLALIEVESQFKVRAQSPVGALGLMQLMPATATHVWKGMGLRVPSGGVLPRRVVEDPFINLSLGVAYLAELRDRYRNLPAYYLVTAYNMGPAKLDELLARPGFRPVKSRVYYREIRKRLPSYLSYRDARAAHLTSHAKRGKRSGALVAQGVACRVDSGTERL